MRIHPITHHSIAEFLDPVVAGGPEHGGSTTTAIFSGIYDGGAGTENVALSPLPFAALAGFPEDTSVADVTWFFN